MSLRSLLTTSIRPTLRSSVPVSRVANRWASTSTPPVSVESQIQPASSVPQDADAVVGGVAGEVDPQREYLGGEAGIRDGIRVRERVVQLGLGKWRVELGLKEMVWELYPLERYGDLTVGRRAMVEATSKNYPVWWVCAGEDAMEPPPTATTAMNRRLDWRSGANQCHAPAPTPVIPSGHPPLRIAPRTTVFVAPVSPWSALTLRSRHTDESASRPRHIIPRRLVDSR
jgi:hypothetical protein